jgi:basic amino acid/polyamine antiporter, APA family
MGFHALSVFEVKIGFLDFSYLEIDSIPIVLIYFFYISLYVYLIKTGKKRGVLGGLIYPSLAIIGSMFVIYGGFSQPQSYFYLLISMSVIALGIVVRPKRN